jgi:hypothetical protein
MMHILCSIYDVKANQYHVPFASPNRELAIRQFAATCRDPASMLSKFPGDFVLFIVGDYNDSNGTLSSVESFENLCNGSNVEEHL